MASEDVLENLWATVKRAATESIKYATQREAAFKLERENSNAYPEAYDHNVFEYKMAAIIGLLRLDDHEALPEELRSALSEYFELPSNERRLGALLMRRIIEVAPPAPSLEN